MGEAAGQQVCGLAAGPRDNTGGFEPPGPCWVPDSLEISQSPAGLGRGEREGGLNKTGREWCRLGGQGRSPGLRQVSTPFPGGKARLATNWRDPRSVTLQSNTAVPPHGGAAPLTHQKAVSGVDSSPSWSTPSHPAGALEELLAVWALTGIPKQSGSLLLTSSMPGCVGQLLLSLPPLVLLRTPK